MPFCFVPQCFRSPGARKRRLRSPSTTECASRKAPRSRQTTSGPPASAQLKARRSPERLASNIHLPRTHLPAAQRSEEHTSELQSHSDIACRLLLEKKNRPSSPC